MRCLCGHPRGWHRTTELVRLVRRCHSWGCHCDRYWPDHDADEPETRPFGRGRGTPGTGAIA